MANGPIVATTCYQHSLRLFLLSCSFIGVLSKDLADTYTIEISSLLPSASCTPSTIKDATKSPSLIIAHKYGPCAPGSHLKPNGEARWRPTQGEILREDQPRVEYINSRLNFKRDSGGGLDPVKESKTTEIPAKMGSPGSGTYVVTLGLGQPVKNVTLIIDSGADLTWTHCKHCRSHCSRQQKTIYDPAESTSYHNISCNSDLCYRAATTTGRFGHCNGSMCQYALHYTDSTYTSVFLAMDKLTVAPTLTFDNFIFGCSQNNWGSFGGAAGYFGLGRGNLSLLAQDAATPTRSNGKVGQYFSYCLPSLASSTGRIILGRGNRGSEFKFTPMITYDEAPSLYGINIVGISVDGKVLSIPSSTFSNAKPIIDSGTVITRLPPTAYAALQDAFRQSMSEYPRARPLFMLDTCYNMSAYATVTIPKVGFYFDTIGKIDLEPSGILYAASTSQVCLAFAGNHADTDVLIYGNVQQQSFGVIYDGELSRIGFAPNKC